MKALRNLMWLTALIAVVAGCSSAPSDGGNKLTDGSAKPSSTGAQNKITIAVIPKGTTHEFWKAVHAGADKAAKELGIEIIWKGPMVENDRESQIKIVEDFTNQKVSAIVLAPLDDTALKPSVDAAIDSGVPVVIFDSDLKSDKYVSFVATDNEKGGEIAGDALAKLLNGTGKVVMLRYQEGSASTANREKGFMTAIGKAPGITVVSSNQYAGPTTETAFQASENLIAPLKRPDGGLSIDGIFCPNESSTFGMLRALQEGGLAGKIKFIGFDSSAKLVSGLESKQIHGLVVQNPFKMGYEAVKTAVSHLKGEKVDKRIDTGVELVTPENMNEDAMKALLNPPSI